MQGFPTMQRATERAGWRSASGVKELVGAGPHHQRRDRNGAGWRRRQRSEGSNLGCRVPTIDKNGAGNGIEPARLRPWQGSLHHAMFPARQTQEPACGAPSLLQKCLSYAGFAAARPTLPHPRRAEGLLSSTSITRTGEEPVLTGHGHVSSRNPTPPLPVRGSDLPSGI